MTTASQPDLSPGLVYRTSDLKQWSANPTRLARRLVRDGQLVQLRHGLYAAPRQSRFGTVPPTTSALLDAFLDHTPWLLSGPPKWNALGLGATALFATPLIYNTKRTGTFELGGRTFMLRRVRFPREPSPEWYVVDLLMNATQAGVARSELAAALRRSVRAGAFDRGLLSEMADQYGTRDVQDCVAQASRP